MKIVENDFILESINDYGELFDVSLLHIVNRGKGNERTEMKVVAYGVPFETALRYVIQYRTSNKLGNETTLKEYINTYKECHKEIQKLIKN